MLQSLDATLLFTILQAPWDVKIVILFQSTFHFNFENVTSTVDEYDNRM